MKKGHVIRVTYDRVDWDRLARVENRCIHAQAAGVIKGFTGHHDAINNVVIYEITYPDVLPVVVPDSKKLRRLT